MTTLLRFALKLLKTVNSVLQRKSFPVVPNGWNITMITLISDPIHHSGILSYPTIAWRVQLFAPAIVSSNGRIDPQTGASHGTAS